MPRRRAEHCGTLRPHLAYQGSSGFTGSCGWRTLKFEQKKDIEITFSAVTHTPEALVLRFGRWSRLARLLGKYYPNSFRSHRGRNKRLVFFRTFVSPSM